MPFFGNILPTLRSYSGLQCGFDGKATIHAQPIVLGMNVPLTLGQRLEASGSSAVGQALDAGRGGETSGKPVRAAQYVRMSTEHQKYSTENQSEAMQQYAARRDIEIVRTYADEGKSGLSLEGRSALKQLIEDVQTKKADFSTILVYDISRWGRFQDADESA
jgi:Resolvase, N terminal domain